MWIRGPLEGVPGRKVILHESRWEPVEVMGMWRLVELGVLLVRGEGPPEVGGTLHSEGWLSLACAPGWLLLMLIVPRCLKLVVPRRVGLVVPGGFTLVVPAGFPLLVPHPFVIAVPWRAMGGPLVMSEWGLIRGLQKHKGADAHMKPKESCNAGSSCRNKANQRPLLALIGSGSYVTTQRP